MRRKDKEIIEREKIEQILNNAEVCRVAMCYENKPYLVPMNFGYKNGYIYLHSAQEGKKIGILRKNPEVCFEVATMIEIKNGEKACNWGTKYCCVIGTGNIIFVEEEAEKIKSLNIIMEKYAGESRYEYMSEALSKVQIMKIQINEMTGKKSG